MMNLELFKKIASENGLILTTAEEGKGGFVIGESNEIIGTIVDCVMNGFQVNVILQSEVNNAVLYKNQVNDLSAA